MNKFSHNVHVEHDQKSADWKIDRERRERGRRGRKKSDLSIPRDHFFSFSICLYILVLFLVLFLLLFTILVMCHRHLYWTIRMLWSILINRRCVYEYLSLCFAVSVAYCCTYFFFHCFLLYSAWFTFEREFSFFLFLYFHMYETLKDKKNQQISEESHWHKCKWNNKNT